MVNQFARTGRHANQLLYLSSVRPENLFTGRGRSEERKEFSLVCSLWSTN
jgi:hypothetical protein